MLSGYYQESEEKFQNRLVKKCQKLFEEKKKMKRQYGREGQKYGRQKIF